MFKFYCEIFGHSYDEFGVCSNCNKESIVRVQRNSLMGSGIIEDKMDITPVFQVIDSATHDILDVYLNEDEAVEFAESISTKTFVSTVWKDNKISLLKYIP